jgi:hypothetical protein
MKKILNILELVFSSLLGLANVFYLTNSLVNLGNLFDIKFPDLIYFLFVFLINVAAFVLIIIYSILCLIKPANNLDKDYDENGLKLSKIFVLIQSGSSLIVSFLTLIYVIAKNGDVTGGLIVSLIFSIAILVLLLLSHNYMKKNMKVSFILLYVAIFLLFVEMIRGGANGVLNTFGFVFEMFGIVTMTAFLIIRYLDVFINDKDIEIVE